MQRFKTIALNRVGGVFLLALTALTSLPTQAAGAVTTLKQVQISNGSQIDLLFDGKVQKGQIHTEFFNDIIQLSISDVSVYPAKISSVNGGSLTKIFAYQYAPKLVRCSLTVKGKAEDFKDKFDLKAGGKILTVRVADGVTIEEAKKDSKTTKESKVAKAGAPSQDAVEERALLSRVLSSDTPPAPTAAAVKEAARDSKDVKDSKDTIVTSAAAPAAASGKNVAAASSSENLPIHSSHAKLGGAKPLPSPLKAFGKMGAVLALFGLCALGFKRFAQNRSESRLGGGERGADLGGAGGSNMLGAISRFAKKNLARNGKMIEVLSSHYLGPKKSISVVRIAGRVLVLGVSNDSINLITQLSGDETDPMGAMDGLDLGGLGIKSSPNVAKAASGARAAGEPVFADLLNAEKAKTSFSRPTAQESILPGASNNSPSSVRAQIRNRLEGLKPL